MTATMTRADGAAPDLPIAVVQDATINSPKVVTGTLATMADRVAQQGLRSPCLIIIGSVVNLHDALAWFRPPLGSAP